MSLRSTRRPLTFQALEQRQQFAADLSLQVINGDLFITGDGDAEAVAIEEVRLGGAFNVEFLKLTGFNGTTINGQSQLTIASGNLRNVTINLNGGDDALDIQRMDSDVAGGNLLVKLGGDDDLFAADGLNFGGNITIEGENGNDDINLANLTVGGLLKIDLGNGDDELDVITSVAKNLDVRGDDGDDVIRLTRLTITDKLFADMGEDDDSLTLDKCKAGLFELDGGDDNDQLTIKFDFGTIRDAIQAANSDRNFETVNLSQG